MDKIFSKKNFIEKEAEEDIPLKLNSEIIKEEIKDTQYSTQENNEDDSYGISNETDDNISEKQSKEYISHRLLLQRQTEKEEKMKNNFKIKRKKNNKMDKNKELIDKKQMIAENAKKNLKKTDEVLGIINGKLNIRFAENKENNYSNNEIDNNTPIKVLSKETDEEVERLKLSNERRKIEKVNKNNNKDFVKRIKENEDFIKRNNILINDGSESKDHLQIKRYNSELSITGNNKFHQKLKLFNFKGAFLNNKKK